MTGNGASKEDIRRWRTMAHNVNPGPCGHANDRTELLKHGSATFNHYYLTSIESGNYDRNRWCNTHINTDREGVFTSVASESINSAT